MADHGGQPQVAGLQFFDVTNLVVTAEGGPPNPPLNIVNTATPFTLTATFTGSGTTWNTIEGLGTIRYRAQYFVERIGSGGFDLPVVPATDEGLLVAGTGTYMINHIVPGGTLVAGLYRMGVIVTFPPMLAAIPPSPGWPGMLGYYEGLLIEASPQG